MDQSSLRRAPLFRGQEVFLTVVTVIALIASSIGRAPSVEIVNAVSDRIPMYLDMYERNIGLACSENLANQVGIGARVTNACLVAARRMQSPDGAPGYVASWLRDFVTS